MHLLGEPDAILQVRSLATFASWDWKEQKFRPEDHMGRFVVHAIKGAQDKLAGKYQNLPIGAGQTEVRVDVSNFEIVARYWAAWAAKRIRENHAGPIVVAPLPSSSATPANDRYRTSSLASLVAAKLGEEGHAWTGLRFREARQPVHAGGSRATIGHDMIRINDPPPGTIVLLDDVFTMGSHANAALELIGPDQRPKLMVTGGQTVWAPPDKVINPPPKMHEWWATN